MHAFVENTKVEWFVTLYKEEIRKWLENAFEFINF